MALEKRLRLSLCCRSGISLKINRMMKENKKGEEIREKFRIGLDLTFKKLVQQKSLTGGIIVLSKKGKIVKVNAEDLNN